jgi:predicted secreted protein
VHRETTIPAHRGNGCPLGYGIAKLYVAGSRLVVHLDMATPGFEGPDINPAFVVLTLP